MTIPPLPSNSAAGWVRAVRVVLAGEPACWHRDFGQLATGADIAILRATASAELWAGLDAFHPDILVVDAAMPGDGGVPLIRAVRDRRGLGIVAITGDDAAERIEALRNGADSCLRRPLETAELDAAIRALALRIPRETRDIWCFHQERWEIAAPDGRAVELSAADYRFLAALTAQPGDGVSLAALAQWLGKAEAIEAGSIHALVSRLRRKVVETAGVPLPVRSVRSHGYVFAGKVAVVGDR
ncbi:MAG: response regulator transcription factor [Magnetospirillum sp.]|nr:response regulator transcription factor [Magnetospirillum sp.]